MRLATILIDRRPTVAVVRESRVLPLDPLDPALDSMRTVAAGGARVLQRIDTWADRQPATAWRALDEVTLAPSVPDPRGIYTIGDNYRRPDEDPGPPPERPLVCGKASSSVGAHRARLTWSRTVTDNVDAQIELGVVIGSAAVAVSADRAMDHVFGYTCINDISSRDPWLDGDQWLIGKSLPGFCPVGPWIVTADDLEPNDLGLGCHIDGEPIQEGRTSEMRTSIAEIIAYLSRHLRLEPGDLIATGTPARLATAPGPDRRLRAGDEVTVWIEGIGELITYIG